MIAKTNLIVRQTAIYNYEQKFASTTTEKIIEKKYSYHAKDLGINVVHIESRKSLRRGSEYDILVDVECDSKRMEQLMKMLSREVAAINFAHYEQIGSIPHAPSLSAAASFGESLRVEISIKSFIITE